MARSQQFRKGQKVRFTTSRVVNQTSQSGALIRNQERNVVSGKVVGFDKSGGEARLVVKMGVRGATFLVHPSQVVRE